MRNPLPQSWGLSFVRTGAVLLVLAVLPSRMTAQQNNAAASLASSAVLPAVPRIIQFSGQFNETSGGGSAAIAPGAVSVTFTLYENEESGAALWSETDNVEMDAQGQYTALVGSSSPNGLPLSLFTTGHAHWLGVRVQGQEEQPRVLLVSVPYALKAGDAETIGGLPPSAFLLAPPGTSSGSTAASTSPGSPSSGSPGVLTGQTVKRALSGSGTTNYIPIWTSNTALGNSEIYQTGGNVGIGTTTPAYPLDVNGNIRISAAYKIGGATVLAIPASDATSIAVGYGALVKDTAPVGGNTATGAGALSSNTTGANNTASGYQALYSNTTGSSNTAGGLNALKSNTIGGDNTASGFDALYSNTTGSNNTANGHFTLYTNSTGSNNTANSTGALFANTTASDNTSSGHRSLYYNTTGSGNTASGFHALFGNTTGSGNTAGGENSLFNNTGNNNTAGGQGALYGNTTASGNTAGGFAALHGNTTGAGNTADGFEALQSNDTGTGNTADGWSVLADNTGSDNTASGYSAMGLNSSGSQNTAVGDSALGGNTTGSNNIAIGYNAASGVSGGNSNNIDIGSAGSSDDSGTIRIGTGGTQSSFFVAGVSGVTTGDNDAVPVMIDSNGQLGTISSSRRFKEDIRDMGEASEDLMRLRPVTFRYKRPFEDGSKPIQYGLIAEEVAEVYPDMVARSADGQIETVKYQVLDPMLLNEVQRQQAEIQGLQERLKKTEAPRRQVEIRGLRRGLDKMEATLASESCTVSSDARQTVTTATNTATNAAADTIVPPLVNFSGVLVDAAGKPVTDMVGVTFSLYREQQSGAPLWIETQNVQPDAAGHYSVMLGAATSAGVPSSLFTTGEAHWLGVQVQGQEEQPRVLLVSVPYALKAGDAETLGGLPPSAFLLAPPGTPTALAAVPSPLGSAPPASPGLSTGPTAKPPQSGSGTTNYIPIWTSSTVLGDSIIYQTGGNVGIGTTTPGSTLDVAGYANTSASYYTTYGSSAESLLATPGGSSNGNTAVNNALLNNTTGSGNTASGYEALFGNTTADSNTAIGASALSKNTTGAQNMADGSGALFNSGPASYNTATGYEALYNSKNPLAYNSASGSGALFSNTKATDNAAEGYEALHNTTTGEQNTGRGSQALFSNTTGGDNGAEGFQALYSNTSGNGNTANGVDALYSNTSADYNTGIGSGALYHNTTGSNNTAGGSQALYSNTTGSYNTADGEDALLRNTTGSENTADGQGALGANTTGSDNTADGYATMLLNTTGLRNTAIGYGALSGNTSGNNNIAVGYSAPSSVSGGNSNSIHIGSAGFSGDNNIIRIGTSGIQSSFFVAGVSGVTTGNNDAVPVMIDSNGQLGTVSSSRRFKEDIRDMGDASDGLLRLRPVTFQYQKPFADGSKPTQYGLIAEEVADVYPDLVVHSADGRIETVKYQVLGPMLLNEVQRQQAEIRALQQQLNENEVRSQQAEIQELRERFGKMKAALASMSCGLETR